MRTFKYVFAFVVCGVVTACGGSAGWEPEGASSTSSSSSSGSSSSSSASSSSSSGQTACSREALEANIENQLAAMNTDTNFSLFIEDAKGESFVYDRGDYTLDTEFESASASKWVSAAVILDLVDKNVLQLTNTPQDHLSESEWPVPESDPLYAINLANLLSFTSGLSNGVPCEHSASSNFFSCVRNIAENNVGNQKTPGQEFYYSSNHLQVAGAMAIRASNSADWKEVFDAFKTETGLFANSSYNLPSTTHPRLAGGMTTRGSDYIQFIRAFKNADFYSSMDLVNTASIDQIAAATIGSSPAFLGLGEQWHYGYGLWIECHSLEYNCSVAEQVSSPGAYGAYPFWNKNMDYFGIVARQGQLGSFTDGYAVFDSVRDELEAWVACEEN